MPHRRITVSDGRTAWCHLTILYRLAWTFLAFLDYEMILWSFGHSCISGQVHLAGQYAERWSKSLCCITWFRASRFVVVVLYLHMQETYCSSSVNCTFALLHFFLVVPVYLSVLAGLKILELMRNKFEWAFLGSYRINECPRTECSCK